jgi:hypothetical protein
MSQIFHRHTNIYSRVSIIALLVFGGALGAGLAALNWSSYNTNQADFVDQNRMKYMVKSGTYEAKVVADDASCADVRAALPE